MSGGGGAGRWGSGEETWSGSWGGWMGGGVPPGGRGGSDVGVGGARIWRGEGGFMVLFIRNSSVGAPKCVVFMWKSQVGIICPTLSCGRELLVCHIYIPCVYSLLESHIGHHDPVTFGSSVETPALVRRVVKCAFLLS